MRDISCDNDGDDNAQNEILFCIQCDSCHKDQCFRRLGAIIIISAMINNNNAQNGVVFCNFAFNYGRQYQCFRRLGAMARKFVSQGAGEIRTSWTRICTSTDENIMEIVEQKFSNQLRAMARKFVSQVRVLFVHQPM